MTQPVQLNKNSSFLFNSERNSKYNELKPRVDRLPCPDCGSSDALSIYLNKTKSGNWSHLGKCFSCGAVTKQKQFKSKGLDSFVDLNDTKPNDVEDSFFTENKHLQIEEEEQVVVVPFNSPNQRPVGTQKEFKPFEGFIPDQPYRGIKPDTFEFFRACVDYDPVDPQKVVKVCYPYFDYKDPAKILAQKVKIPDRPKKDMGIYVEGSLEKSGPFGFNLFSQSNNTKYLLICEGEEDAMSAWQMMGGKYPTISVKNGAGSLVNEVRRFYDYINAFSEIRICMDPDEPGLDAVKKLCDSGLIEFGKLKLVRLNPNIGDVNDYLRSGKEQDFAKAFWAAQDYQPEGVVLSSTLAETCLNPPRVDAYSYPFSTLQETTFGKRLGEFDIYGARSGIGKTSVLKEFALHDLLETNEKIGLVLFEEPNIKTLRSFVGMYLNKRIDIPGHNVSREEFMHGWEQLQLNEDRLCLWDVQVSSWELEPILKNIEFMVATQDIKFLYVDFLQCIKLNQDSTEERIALDRIAETFAKLVAKRNIHISSTTQLNRATGEIRGSSGIEQFSHKIVLLERDKKHKEERYRRVTRLTIDKNRFNGTTGPAGYLEFNTDTGRLVEVYDIDEDTFDGKTKKGA